MKSWLSSSTKELEPVVAIDGNAVGKGEPDPFGPKRKRCSANTASTISHEMTGTPDSQS